jgi:hypothetical protein
MAFLQSFQKLRHPQADAVPDIGRVVAFLVIGGEVGEDRIAKLMEFHFEDPRPRGEEVLVPETGEGRMISLKLGAQKMESGKEALCHICIIV